jgi:DNA polymerase-3 subunit alpha
MPSNFIHLHVHSEYSLLDGAIKVERLVSRAKELGMNAVALTDHGNMFGAIKFFKTAKQAGIKPIIGIETYLTRGSRLEKGKKRGELSKLEHLVLLAKDMRGYKNLMRLSSAAYLEGFYYKPRVDMDLLAEHSEGLIALSSCVRGVVARSVLEEGLDGATAKAERFRSLFGDGNFYLEIQDHGLEEEKKVIEASREISKRTGIPLVATNDAHYLRREDAEAHEVLLCLQTGNTLEDPNRFRFKSKELYFKTEEEMKELFPDLPEALENTVAVAEMCDLDLSGNKACLPTFPLPPGYDSDSAYLRDEVFKGAERRYGGTSDEVRDRLEYELSVIEKMDFPGYFLIVKDIVDHAKESGIPVGPGRGSAAGSLVCYCLGITDVDPLKYDLLFERLLNPERVSMPDIDIDFCFERRDEIIRYVIDRYSKENVCQIITFGTMAARGVVRDVGRVLKIPYAEVDRIAKLIPAQIGTTLEEALESVPDLKKMVEENPLYKKLMKLSLTLEGLTRHASIHAAGMIITPTPLVNHIPLYRTNKGEITSQYDMKSIEYIGLLKIDLLGLRTLTVIDKTIRMIKENHGVELKPEDIPTDDPDTFELLRNARTVGVFQLESAGMRELLKNLEPEGFNDIVAVNALYRPGPLGSDMVNYFVECKHGKKKIEYEHPSLEPILRETYGVILYQEQVMRIASNLAGFSLGEADLLRKAMGKKDKKVMVSQRKKFIQGAAANGIPKTAAQKIFGKMEKFALYGFNKSHSAAYAVISVRTAYLKKHYPAEFMAASLTSEIDDSDRIIVLLDECRELGIEVVPPDINVCDAEFRVVKGKITYGLAAVKNVGMNAVRHIIKERKANGEFSSLTDFCSRVSSKVVNRRVIESLIQAGALDSLPGHRARKMKNLDRILERAQRRSRDAEIGQITFAFSKDSSPGSERLEDCEPWSPQEQLRREKEALGFFLSGHPLDKFKHVLEMMSTMTTADLKAGRNGKHAVVGGMVTAVKTTFDRKQNPMAFITIEDGKGQAEAIAFSEVLEKYRKMIMQDSLVILEGKISCLNGGEGKLLVNSVAVVDDDHIPPSKELHLFLDLSLVSESKIDELKKLLSGKEGSASVFFHLHGGGNEKCTIRSRRLSVDLDHDLLRKLSASVGVQNVRLVPAGYKG